MILTSFLCIYASAQEEKKTRHYVFGDVSIVWLGNIDNPAITGSLGWERSFRETRSIRYGFQANYTIYSPYCDLDCPSSYHQYFSIMHHWKFQWVHKKYEFGVGASYGLGLTLEHEKDERFEKYHFPRLTSRLDLYLTTGKLIPWVSIEPFVGGYAIVSYDDLVNLAGIQLPIFSLRLNFHLQR